MTQSATCQTISKQPGIFESYHVLAFWSKSRKCLWVLLMKEFTFLTCIRIWGVKKNSVSVFASSFLWQILNIYNMSRTNCLKGLPLCGYLAVIGYSRSSLLLIHHQVGLVLSVCNSFSYEFWRDLYLQLQPPEPIGKHLNGF